MPFKTIIEPFKIKTVEPIRWTTRQARAQLLQRAHYNLFLLPADAIYLDARAFLPHIPPASFPGVALGGALYLEGGIRSVEIGTLMFGPHATMDLVRLAIPRRVYTQSHIDYVVEVILEVWKRREEIRGLRLAYEAPFLRHFTARLEPV
jgi:tryptophanase